jgi:hypothetical protein
LPQKLLIRYVTIFGASEDASIAVLEAPTVVAGLDDVAMMRQAIQHGGGHSGVAEYLRPIRKCQIGSDEQRRVFVQLADQVEQQLAAWLAERQVAQLVDGNEIVASQFLGETAGPASCFLLLELIDEIDQVEEAPVRTRTNDRRGDADAQMRFAGAGRTRGILPNITTPTGGLFIGITLATVKAWRS